MRTLGGGRDYATFQERICPVIFNSLRFLNTYLSPKK